MLHDQIRCDLIQIFRDWGQEAIYRVVSSELDLKTEQLEETYEDHVVLALWGEQSHLPLAASARQALSPGRKLILRECDLPEDAPQLTDRILIERQELRIIEFVRESRGELIVLTLEQ